MYVHVCMYMYVCMFVCMIVCMHVSIYVRRLQPIHTVPLLTQCCLCQAGDVKVIEKKSQSVRRKQLS